MMQSFSLDSSADEHALKSVGRRAVYELFREVNAVGDNVAAFFIGSRLAERHLRKSACAENCVRVLPAITLPPHQQLGKQSIANPGERIGEVRMSCAVVQKNAPFHFRMRMVLKEHS